PPRHVLDIGCGDGAILLFLAETLPAAALVGVDISSANIGLAAMAIDQSPHRDRIRLVHADYVALDAGRFDLVVSSSALQGIGTTTEQLAASIARDVAPSGHLVHVTPYRCGYNSVLNAVRTVLRTVRSRPADHMILMVARLLHRGRSRAYLNQRVDYMYLVIRNYEDELRAALERRGFTLDHIEDAPHTSIGQPKHRLAVMSAPERS
ncbi:MAG TPA: class I SAM-dependent methyltransferase, partial [Vicinamibacterales bacterium]